MKLLSSIFFIWALVASGGAIFGATDHTCSIIISGDLTLCQSYGVLEEPFLKLTKDRCHRDYAKRQIPWLQSQKKAETDLQWKETACPDHRRLGLCEIQQFDVKMREYAYYAKWDSGAKLVKAYRRAFVRCKVQEGTWQRDPGLNIKIKDEELDIDAELDEWTTVQSSEIAKALGKIDNQVSGSIQASCLTLINKKPTVCESYEGLTAGMAKTQELVCDSTGMGMEEVTSQWGSNCPKLGRIHGCLSISSAGLKTTMFYYDMAGRDAKKLEDECNKTGKWFKP